MHCLYKITFIAGWSSPVARQAHNLKVVGSNPAPATSKIIKPSYEGFMILNDYESDLNLREKQVHHKAQAGGRTPVSKGQRRRGNLSASDK